MSCTFGKPIFSHLRKCLHWAYVPDCLSFANKVQVNSCFFLSLFGYFFLNTISELFHLDPYLLSTIKEKHYNKYTGHGISMTQFLPTITCEGRERGGGRESYLLRIYNFQTLLSHVSFTKVITFTCTEKSCTLPKPKNDALLPTALGLP